MNIFKFEMKMINKSILYWTSGIVGFILMYMVFYPTMMQDNDAMQEVMQNFPEEFLAFFGMSADLSFTSLLGYWGLTMSFVYIPIAVQASHYGFSILSMEERELTADFLMTKPVSRRTIFLSKFFSAFVALLITNIGVWAGSLLSLYLFNGGDEVILDSVFWILGSIIIFQLFFLTVGMAVSVSVKKIDSVIAYSMGLGFGMFIISSFGEMLSNRFLQVLSIYSHFNPVDILVDGHYDWGLFPISIIVSITAFIVGYILYQRRNIASL